MLAEPPMAPVRVLMQPWPESRPTTAIAVSSYRRHLQGQQPVMAALAAAHLQDAVREDAALEESYVLLEAF